MKCPFTRAGFAAAILVIASTTALANKAKPPSGTPIILKVGETTKVQVTGTQGCKFDTLRSSSNGNVASVVGSSLQKSAHTIEIVGVSVGQSDVTIMTANGSIVACQGYTFMYSVTVEPNEAAAIAQVKKKFGDASKDLRDLFKEYVNGYTAGLKTILDDNKDGTISTDAALDQVLDLTIDSVDGLYADKEAELDDLFDDAESRLTQFGITNDNFPVTLADGGCGITDMFMEKVEKDYIKAKEQMHDKLKKFGKDLDKARKLAGNGGVLILVPPVITTIGSGLIVDVQVLPAPPPPPPKPLSITWVGSARASEATTSKVVTGGLADETGGNVTVTIDGPGGSTSTVNVPVDNKCRWKATFPSLPPGDYVITATQGTNGPVTRTHKVL